MDERFHAYLKHVKGLEEARQATRRFDQGVTVGQNDKELRLASGSKIDDFDPKVGKYRAKYAPRVQKRGLATRRCYWHWC